MEPIIVPWPGGEHLMMLSLAQLEGLQNKTDAGPEFLLNKISLGQWSASDLFETLRWGLVGGGMDPLNAEKLMQRVFPQHPLAGYKIAALKVLAHALYGPADDTVGEGGPVKNPTPDQQKTENGDLATSTD